MILFFHREVVKIAASSTKGDKNAVELEINRLMVFWGFFPESDAVWGEIRSG